MELKVETDKEKFSEKDGGSEALTLGRHSLEHCLLCKVGRGSICGWRFASNESPSSSSY